MRVLTILAAAMLSLAAVPAMSQTTAVMKSEPGKVTVFSTLEREVLDVFEKLGVSWA